jgi:hypothetical protein
MDTVTPGRFEFPPINSILLVGASNLGKSTLALNTITNPAIWQVPVEHLLIFSPAAYDQQQVEVYRESIKKVEVHTLDNIKEIVTNLHGEPESYTTVVLIEDSDYEAFNQVFYRDLFVRISHSNKLSTWLSTQHIYQSGTKFRMSLIRNTSDFLLLTGKQMFPVYNTLNKQLGLPTGLLTEINKVIYSHQSYGHFVVQTDYHQISVFIRESLKLIIR